MPVPLTCECISPNLLTGVHDLPNINKPYMSRLFIVMIMSVINYNLQLFRSLTYLLHGVESFLTSSLVLQLVKKFPATLCNPKFHHCIHKCPPSVPILSQLHPVSTPSLFPKIHIDIVLPSTSRSPQWPLSLRFSH